MSRPFNSLRYTNHALSRLISRSIPALFVREAVRTGARRASDGTALFILRSVHGHPLARNLVVVLSGCVVVTVYWRGAPCC